MRIHPSTYLLSPREGKGRKKMLDAGWMLVVGVDGWLLQITIGMR
jgi:hypothetical protein